MITLALNDENAKTELNDLIDSQKCLPFSLFCLSKLSIRTGRGGSGGRVNCCLEQHSEKIGWSSVPPFFSSANIIALQLGHISFKYRKRWRP